MDLTLFERDMERMMDDFFGRRTRPWWPERRFRTEGFEIGGPAVDLYEEKDDIVVKAELPGMERDNIEVNLTDHTLTLKGEKKRGRGQRQVRALLRLLPSVGRAAEGRSCRQSQSLVRERYP
jgi:HSP20 family molecular chaperone IbpA